MAIIGTAIFDSNYEEQVCNGLVKRGYDVMTQFPFHGFKLDLAILNPKIRYLFALAVECDSVTFHSEPWKKEEDAKRQTYLESRGWVIERIMSSDWWKNRDKVLTQIEYAIWRQVGKQEYTYVDRPFDYHSRTNLSTFDYS